MGRATWVVVCLGIALVGGGRPGAAQEAAPAAAVGTVSGTVIDKGSGDPIIEAGVEVILQGKTVRTDLDGRFTVKLPPGTYQLRIFAPLFQGARLQSVIVKAGEVTRADAALASQGQAGVEVVEVVEQARKAAEATQLIKRQKAAVVSDNVSAETIKKSPDSDAAEVVQRVPAVTVKDDKFVVIRGLGERYSSALLNGSRLPSPDPEKRVVPLDLFPADFLDALSIIKTYTPDLPGDFSGGLADIELVEFPDKLQYSVGLSTSYNTSTTFKKYQTYQGSDLDYFGFGKDFRDLPDGFTSDPLSLSLAKRLPAPAYVRHVTALGRQLKNIWNVDSEIAPPNSGFNFSVGNSWGPFGFELGGTYETEYQTRRNEISRQYFSPNAQGIAAAKNDFRLDTSEFTTRLGGVMTAAYKLANNHKLGFRGLVDRNSEDQVVTGTGVGTQLPDTLLFSNVLQYTEEQLGFGQLSGEHKWSWVDLEWRSALSQTTQDIPDTRTLTYQRRLGFDIERQYASGESGNGTRRFSSLRENLTDSGFDVTLPFTTRLPLTDVWSGLRAKLQLGGAYALRDRKSVQRFFGYEPPADRFPLPPEEIFEPSSLGVDETTVRFSERTRLRDVFDAIEEIAGGYAMFDLPIVRDRLRFIGGVRLEYSLIRLETADEADEPVKILKRNLDPLPGANLVLSPRPDMNVRFGYSQTVSRPEFREMTPSIYSRPRGFLETQGNPNLVQAEITNWDLRWEWFFAPGELVSFGLFYKELTNPIETTVFPAGSLLRESFQNTPEATLKGFELEGRKQLGFLHKWLEPFSFQMNLAYIESEASGRRQAEFLGVDSQIASDSGPLQGQAPFVVNAAIEYAKPDVLTARLLYNTAGDQVKALGTQSRKGGAGGEFADYIEKRRNQLDFVLIAPLARFGLPITLKAGVENIFNEEFEVRQGTLPVTSRYLKGTKFSLGFSYSY